MKPILTALTAIALICANPGANGVLRSQTQDEASQAQLLRRIIDVLSATAAETKKWDDKAVAARTQAQIADLIWDASREEATEYLKAAWTATGQIEEPKRDRSTFVNPSLRNEVRRDVLLVARKRAPEFAAKWLDEMVEVSKSAEKTDRGTFDDRTARSAVLLQMANELVAHNPRTAAELLIESLSDGISFSFQTILTRIQQKDAALGETVFRAALAHLKAAGMNDPNELLILYAYLYTPGRVFGANTSENPNQRQLAVGGSPVSIPPGRQNPALAREFLGLASDLLLSTPLPDANNAQIAARALVSTIGILLREVAQQLPEKAALLQARAHLLHSEARFSTTPSERRNDIPETRPGESKESFSDRRVDLLEELAAKGRDQLTRDIGYATAAMATTVDRYQRGLDLAGRVDDKTLREGVRSWLIYRAVLHFIAAGKLDEAYRLNLKNDDASQRAVCLVVGAQNLAKKKDTVRAADWLGEAGALVKSGEPSEALARITLGIVSTYGRFDTQASLEWLLHAVKLMRKTSAASLNEDQAPPLKRVSGITTVTDLTSGTAGFSLQSAVAVFSPDQFEQVLSVINEVTPREARGMAVVTLCSNYLKTMPKATKKLSRFSSSVPAAQSGFH